MAQTGLGQKAGGTVGCEMLSVEGTRMAQTVGLRGQAYELSVSSWHGAWYRRYTQKTLMDSVSPSMSYRIVGRGAVF